MLATLVPIFLSAVLGTAGQLLLKIGMSQIGALELNLATIPTIVWRMATSPYVVGGLFVYVSGTFFWLIVLSRMQLSQAYPFASLSYVLITIAAWGLLHEEVSLIRWMGILVVCLGIVLVAKS